MHFTKTTLKNGMRVITVPMKDTKSLTLLVLFGTGSRYETKKTNGVSHVLEHLFFKGTKSRPKAGQVSQALDDIGAEHNAFTAKEYTGYWVKASSHQFPLALDIVSDILLEPLFKAEEIEKERGVIFQELSMYLDTPRRYIHDLFESLLFGDQPIGWEIIGTPQSLQALQRKDILAYRSAQYVGSNAVVVIAGAFSEKDAQRQTVNAFEKFPVGSPKNSKPSKKNTARSAVHLEFKKTDQSHVVMGALSYSMFDDRRYAATLLTTILGGKTSSRLFQEIREKRGLAYTVSAVTEQFLDTGYFSVYAGVPHQKVKEVVRRIRDECYTVRDNGISARELQRAKDFWRGQFAISLESSDEIASFFGARELFYGEVVSPEELMKRIEQVSVEDVQKAARDIFKSNSFKLALIGPHRGTVEFSELLSV
jgi:predicted Zn-dependent peptidase